MIKKNTKIESTKQETVKTANPILLKKQELIKEKTANPFYGLQETIQAELKPIINALISQDKKIIELQDKQEKTFTILFNDNSDKNFTAIFNKIETIEKVLQVLFNNQTAMIKQETVKPAITKQETVKPESIKPDSIDSDSFIDKFRKAFNRNFREEEFKQFIKTCNFESVETMKESFRVFNSTNDLLCARKSNSIFLETLWDINEKMKGNNKTGKIAPISKPPVTIATYAGLLNCKEKELEEWINMVKLQGFIDNEEDKGILITIAEESNGIECEEEHIDSFIQFVADSLKIKVKSEE